MKNERCYRCRHLNVCREESRSWFFIVVGLISTVAIRVVTVLMNVNPIYGKMAWYVGVTGFFIFFIYKYRVFKARARLIEENRLIEKISQRKQLSEQDYESIAIILCKIKSNKERINFLFIFIVSAIALTLAIYYDFLPLLRNIKL